MRMAASKPENIQKFAGTRIDSEITNDASAVPCPQPVNVMSPVPPQINANDRAVSIPIDQLKHVLQWQDMSLGNSFARCFLIIVFVPLTADPFSAASVGITVGICIAAIASAVSVTAFLLTGAFAAIRKSLCRERKHQRRAKERSQATAHEHRDIIPHNRFHSASVYH
jgi:hypothetical protein